MYHYSASTKGFYNSEVHAADSIPADAVEITDARHAELLAAQSLGKVIGADADGKPVASPPPAYVMTAADARAKRDALLRSSDWTQIPDVPEATRAKWTAYRQALRDITAQPAFPATIAWPTPPASD